MYIYVSLNISISLLIIDYIFKQLFPILNMTLEQAGGKTKQNHMPNYRYSESVGEEKGHEMYMFTS